MPQIDSDTWHIRLAFALYDLQTAHTNFEGLKPADKQFQPRLDELKAALEEYKRVVEWVESLGSKRTQRLD